MTIEEAKRTYYSFSNKVADSSYIDKIYDDFSCSKLESN